MVRAAVDGARAVGAPPGAVAVQLREKDLPGGPLLALARELRQITRAAGAALYVNDRVDVALAAQADGVHLGGQSVTPADVRHITSSLSIAVSTHTMAEVEQAARDNVDFAVFGPVFDTPSKRAFGPPVGTVALAAACHTTVPIIALGGIDCESFRNCIHSGSVGVACIRALMGAHDPARAVAAFGDVFLNDLPLDATWT